MKNQVGSEDVYYEFGVQLQHDPASMPVEDPLALWDETASPFQRVAIIRIPKQDIDADSRAEIAENLAFTPWHSLPEHRPLGSNNRARRVIYEAVSSFGAKPTKCPRRAKNHSLVNIGEQRLPGQSCREDGRARRRMLQPR